MPISKRQLYALLLLVGILLALIFLDAVVRSQGQTAAVLAVDFEDDDPVRFPFGSQQQQADNPSPKPSVKIAGCTAEGSLSVGHNVCKPPGETDGKQCAVSGLPDGQYIYAQCRSGCCMAVDFTSGSSAGGGIGSLIQGAFGALTQFLGVGGGGSGSGSGADGAFDNWHPIVQPDDGLLNFDDGPLGDTDLLFEGADDDDIQKFLQTPTVSENTPDDGEVEDSGVVEQEKTKTQTGDTISTAYEYLKSLTGDLPVDTTGQDVDRSLSGEDDFTQDYFETGLNDFEEAPVDDGTLSRANLELQGREALDRGRGFEYESLSNSQRNSVQNYRSSGVAGSNSTNPLASDRFNVDVPQKEPEGPNKWQLFLLKIIDFFSFSS